MENLYPGGVIDPIVQSVIEGAQHTEYELRAVKKVLPADFAGKSRILLNGVLDLVIQQQAPLTYQRVWQWDSLDDLTGHAAPASLSAAPGDVEIWDYKATRAATPTLTTTPPTPDIRRPVQGPHRLAPDPLRPLLHQRKEGHTRLLAIDVDDTLVQAALDWTEEQVRELQATTLILRAIPTVTAGELVRKNNPLGQRLTSESTQQCTACSFRFGWKSTKLTWAAGRDPDVDLLNVMKN